MWISEKKMQIVINNYFKQECDINTSIRGAFEKGFRIGVKKGQSAQPERKIELYGDESAIDILSELRSWFSCFDEKEGLAYHALSLAIRAIKANSIAQAERNTGHWVEIGDEPYDEWECDMCGFVIDGSGCIDPEEYKDVYKFCPNCGAKMAR